MANDVRGIVLRGNRSQCVLQSGKEHIRVLDGEPVGQQQRWIKATSSFCEEIIQPLKPALSIEPVNTYPMAT